MTRRATLEILDGMGAAGGRDDVALVVGAARRLRVAEIRRDGGTQPRAAMDADLVAEYGEAMEAGATFPPVVVFFDGEAYWLADGFHRVMAVAGLGWYEIPAEVRQGTRRDAVLYSVGANATHGARRTNADKRRAVLALLEDAEWGRWSDREIARRAAVSDRFVNTLRAGLSANGSQIDERRVQRGESEYTMKTGNVGAAGRPAAQGPRYATLTELEVAIGDWLEAFEDQAATLAELADDGSLAAQDLRECLTLHYRASDLPLAVKLFQQRMAATAKVLGTVEPAARVMPVSGLVRAEAERGSGLWTFSIHLALPWARMMADQRGTALRQAASALETWAGQLREEAEAV